jgi:hypothetical protein
MIHRDTEGTYLRIGPLFGYWLVLGHWTTNKP